MPAKITIIDGQGSGQFAGVTSVGELLVAGFGNLKNTSVFRTMSSTNTAYNFFGPIAGQIFIITCIVFDGPVNTTISFYEAETPSTITIEKLVYKVDLRVAGNLTIPFSFGGFLSVSEGYYLNAFTDAATVNMTIIGHYHPTTRIT
jgi:hypothetical protein